MKAKKVFLLLNGEAPIKRPDISAYSLVCATDGAYNTLNALNIKPDFISGDFDSIKAFPNGIELIKTPDQNFTDFYKILQILFARGYLHIDVFGASGKEQDHFLGNLHTALQWKEKLNITFFDNHGFYFLADKTVELSGCKGKYVSLYPFPEATGIITKGLEYPLNNETLSLTERIGTRNTAVEDAVTVSFKTGHLFIFINENK